MRKPKGERRPAEVGKAIEMAAKRKSKKRKPRILVVTPEITYLPSGMGNMANRLAAKAGGLADVSASLVAALFEAGADVHVALPHYRQLFNVHVGNLISRELRTYQSKLADDRIHLAEDRIFYYRSQVYSSYADENPRIALAFQREVINNIIPFVRPDLIHCNDWMTGLIPAYARRLGIPCLFTVHNIHTHKMLLANAEDRGIDAAGFWQYLYYDRPPFNYEETRDTNPVDMLASGIFASHFINTVSPTFLNEVVRGDHSFVPEAVRAEFAQKAEHGCAVGILNAPDPEYNPADDPHIDHHFTADTVVEGKRANKLEFQRRVGLTSDPDAPLLFWPSRLDPIQKGCQLLTDILFQTISKHWESGIQLAVVANGSYQEHFHNVVNFHGFHDRVAICNFSEDLSHLGYAASDYTIMPSRFEPCGLPQMVSCLYGSLPIVHDTGGLHDTVEHLDPDADTGNGFRFEHYTTDGLAWAIDEAMRFHKQPREERTAQIQRVMTESAERFTHAVTAQKYIDIYESMLHRPLVKDY
jgi:starch synthase